MKRAGPVTLPQAFFLPTDSGPRFCLFHPAHGAAPKGRVLYLHPFAEELNSTRRTVAQQARALAQAGYGVLQIDLMGCGDSAGEFVDATWPTWLDDAQQATSWLGNHCSGPLWIWGMRSGALLAAQLVNLLRQRGNESTHLLLWQPVASGQQMLQQFLRLHAASQWLGSPNAKEQPPAKSLEQGLDVDIAGYTLSPALAKSLSEARLQPPALRQPARLVWLEVSSQTPPMLNPAANKQLAAWRAAGWHVQAQAVSGPAFWQTVGTDEAPALIRATMAALALPTSTPPP